MSLILLAVAAIIAAVYSIQTGVVQGALDWLRQFVLVDIADIFWRLCPDGLAEKLQSIDMDAVASLVSDINWFIPFWQMATLYFTAISLASTVLLIRYIIGWIPTIEG